MLILSIETSCDDTSIALVEVSQKKGQKSLGRMRSILAPEFKVIKNIVSSQTAIHSHWGGVVPSLAKREHLKNLPKVWKAIQTLYPKGRASGSSPKPYTLKGEPRALALSPDLISVTVGPGLEPSLWTGIEFAKKLSQELKIPLVGVNHLEGHLYSFLLPKKTVIANCPARHARPGVAGGQLPIINSKNKLVPERSRVKLGEVEGLPKLEIGNCKLEFPGVVLLVSGGHTILTLMKDLTHWEKLGETRDDAVGEAYDKVAKMMGLPYPGGPEIEKLAAEGDPNAIKFPRPMVHEKNYEFSFSGLKTSVLYYLKNFGNSHSERSEESDKPYTLYPIPHTLISNIAASFQSAAIDVLVKKTMRAVRAFGAKSVFLCGGVAANKTLRSELEKHSNQNGAQFFAPDFEYNTDNAAMIAVAAYMRRKSRKKSYSIEANSNLSL